MKTGGMERRRRRRHAFHMQAMAETVMRKRRVGCSWKLEGGELGSVAGDVVALQPESQEDLEGEEGQDGGEQLRDKRVWQIQIFICIYQSLLLQPNPTRFLIQIII